MADPLTLGFLAVIGATAIIGESRNRKAAAAKRKAQAARNNPNNRPGDGRGAHHPHYGVRPRQR
jgi:hypothetical protein